jgi:hypothetical protein
MVRAMDGIIFKIHLFLFATFAGALATGLSGFSNPRSAAVGIILIFCSACGVDRKWLAGANRCR